MTSSVCIFSFVFTACSFFRRSRTLRRCSCGGRTFFLAIATIGANCSIVNFTGTTIGFAAIAFLTQQLNIAGFAASSAREWSDVVVF